MKNDEHPYLSLATIERWVPLMRELGVSEVARSPRGFLTAFRRAGGNEADLSDAWRSKRNGFIERHMAQLAGHEALYHERRGVLQPTRRHLALVAWAFSPDPRGVARMRVEEG